MHRSLASIAIVFATQFSALAEQPKPIEITLRARAIETPLLKYRLLPVEGELKPGNAVPILLRLPWEQTAWMSAVYPKLHEWESRPLDAPEWETSGGVLPERFYDEMKRAAFRRDAGWEYPIGETASPYLIVLPDVQGLRGFLGYGLAAKIRYHLSRRELDKAREGILVGLADARHLARTPFYINQLVALAIHRHMFDRADELIAQPGSPNLYWALSSLPDSLIELHRTASFEFDIFAQTFPAVNDLGRPRSPKEWNKMARQLLEFLETVGEIPRQKKIEGEGSVVEQLLRQLMPAEKNYLEKLVGEARADLPKLMNVPAEKVAAMSAEEAGLRWYAQLRINRDQRAASVLMLPPSEAWPELRKFQAEAKAMQEKTGTKGYNFLDPTSIYLNAWSLRRKIQGLRIIEAVRNHLASHDGQLPATLDEIKDVPIPTDPLTGQPFTWKVEGKTATLLAPALPKDVVSPGSADDVTSHLEYRIRVK